VVGEVTEGLHMKRTRMKNTGDCLVHWHKPWHQGLLGAPALQGARGASQRKPKSPDRCPELSQEESMRRGTGRAGRT